MTELPECFLDVKPDLANDCRANLKKIPCPGDCALVRSGPKMHLFVFLSGPLRTKNNPHPYFLCASVTSLPETHIRSKEILALLDTGDHPFINHQSYVSAAFVGYVNAFQLKKRCLRWKPRLEIGTLLKVTKGVFGSGFLKKRTQKFIRKHFAEIRSQLEICDQKFRTVKPERLTDHFDCFL